MKVPELQLYAGYYLNFGMNITHVKGGESGMEIIEDPDGNINYKIVDYDKYRRGFKTPTDIDWENYAKEIEDDDYILGKDWENATGIGLITGYNDFRAIDIDGLYVGKSFGGLDTREAFSSIFIMKCLEILELPSDYPWVVRSGSGEGFHIIFLAKDVDGLKIDNKGFSPNNDWISNYYDGLEPVFERVELNWRYHLVLPPSQHYSGNEKRYTFLSGKLPINIPSYVSIENINALFSFLCSVSKIENCSYKGQNIKLIRNHKRTCKFSSLSPEIFDVKSIDDSVEWLLACNDSDSYNTLGVMYSMGINCKANLSLAKEYFEKSNTDMAHFNLATLISCGAINGKESDVKELLADFNLFDENPELPGITSKDLLNIKNMAFFNCNEPFFLFFDTETTGLPKNQKSPVSDTGNWPRLVQMSWMLTDKEGGIISTHNFIIKPDGFTIPKDSVKIHGITMEIANAQGKSLINVLTAFEKDYRKAKYFVGHNIDYDKKVVGCEYYRLNKQTIGQLMVTKNSICTMKSTIDYCAIQGLWGYKYPKLQDLHKKIFGSEFKGAHNAETDILATFRCFFELLNRGIISIAEFNQQTQQS